MKKIILIIIILNLYLIGLSQTIGINYLHKTHFDKIEIDCGNNIVVNLKYPAYNYKDSLTNEANTIDLLLNTVKPVLDNLTLDKTMSYSIILEYPISCAGIVCKKKESFKVNVMRNNVDTKEYLATEYGDSLTPKLTNIIKFQQDNILIAISDLSKLDSIKRIDFKKLLAKHTKKVMQEKLYKFDINTKYTYSNGEFKINYLIKVRKRKPYLAIRPSIGIGAGLIKGQLVNNGSVLVESSFNDYGKGAIRLYAQYEYFANYNGNTIYSSGFINLGANLAISVYECHPFRSMGATLKDPAMLVKNSLIIPHYIFSH
jgi:hypothetical protein